MLPYLEEIVKLENRLCILAIGISRVIWKLIHDAGGGEFHVFRIKVYPSSERFLPAQSPSHKDRITILHRIILSTTA